MFNRLSYILSGNDKLKLFFVFILIIGGSFLELISVAIFQPFTEMLMNPEAAHKNRFMGIVNAQLSLSTYEQLLTAMCIIIILIFLVKNAYLWLQQYFTLRVSYAMSRKNSNRLLTAYMNVPYAFHLNRNVSELQRNLRSDVGNFSSFVMTCLQVLNEIIVCITLGVFLYLTSNSMTVVVGGLLILCVGLFMKITRRVTKKLGQDRRYYERKMIQWISQAFGGIKEIKVLNRENFFIAAYRKYQKLYTANALKKSIISYSSRPIIEVVAISGLLIAIIIKINYGRSDTADFISQLAVFAMAAFRMLPSASRINEGFSNIIYAYPSVELLYDDLKEIEDVCIRAADEDGPESGWRLDKVIELKQVTFSYPGSSELILDNASLSIPKGKTVAFVGSSGAGKTTIADIILGVISPQMGKVLADGMDIHKNIDMWHRQIGYIPQNIYLSDDSIRNNIAFGIKDELIDDTAVEAALKKAQLYEFVENLPDGPNTFVGDRGVRLSGGQRQRIGIARALYHDPEILVLDEATSSLDNETEAAVMEAIDSLKGIKTMLIIAHRLTTIENADIIYEVVDGKVKERRP